MSKKFKFSIDGTEFQLPISQVREDSYSDTKEKYIYMNAKSAASVIKQFVKQYFPDIKVWATSDVYSGGSSVRVNVSNKDGSSVHQNIFEQISEWEYKLKGGSFNGMIDMYEYREDSPSTDNGTPLKYFPSYIFIENKPKWDSVEYWYDKIVNLGEKLEDNITYMGKGVEDKVKLAISKGL
tara:strand:- start:204 stop:746 length:543 start_codon:yes stop_codon:yes gene_type:complete